MSERQIPRLLSLGFLFFVFLSVDTAFADQLTSSQEGSSPIYVHERGNSESPKSRNAVRLYVGSFNADGNPGKLEDERHNFTLGIGGSFNLPKTDHLSFDLEFWMTQREYDTTVQAPLFGTIDDRMTLNTMAVLLGVRGFYPADSRFRIYGTGGLGMFFSKLTATGQQLGFPGEIEDKDQSMGLHAGGGAEMDLGDWIIGVDYRRWFVKGSFDKFGASNVDIGGDFIGASIGMHF